MQITKSTQAGMHVAVMDGRLDTATAPVAEGELMAMLATPGLVLDMTAVRYVSSAGLRLLLKMAKDAKGKGAKFALAGLQPAVREVFEISGFDKIIPAFPTVADAAA